MYLSSSSSILCTLKCNDSGKGWKEQVEVKAAVYANIFLPSLNEVRRKKMQFLQQITQ